MDRSQLKDLILVNGNVMNINSRIGSVFMSKEIEHHLEYYPNTMKFVYSNTPLLKIPAYIDE